jgi:small nuclear ribonucleoprotein G
MDKKMIGAPPHLPRGLPGCCCLPFARHAQTQRYALPATRRALAAQRADATLPAVKLNGNRKVTGTLRGFDQFLNIVLDESVDGTTKESMGMVVIRGNSILLLEPMERVF